MSSLHLARADRAACCFRAQIGGLELQELNRLETELLFRIGFRLHVRREEYDAAAAALLEQPTPAACAAATGCAASVCTPCAGAPCRPSARPGVSECGEGPQVPPGPALSQCACAETTMED